ncbi:MAG TPA: VCBS repeat-containing protein, partial [Blastocatellia bacterium]|nr:VCBS repeat-containing protein [Blastocatellia bacterium]
MKLSNRLLFIPFFALVIAILYSTPIMRARASKVMAQDMSDRRGPLDKQVSVRAAGRAAPWINLRDGHDLPADYQGGAKILQALKSNQARPLAIASADFDEDGVSDLVGAYEAAGGGAIAVRRGDADTIFPNSPEALARRGRSSPDGILSPAIDDLASPFLSLSRAFDVSAPPQLLGAGDFDGDGHADVIAATVGGDALALLAGDGHGGFAPARPVALPGKVTALATGDVNRMDGLAEVIVGVAGGGGPRLLIFEGSAGAIKSPPEIVSLPAEAKSIASGQLDDDYPVDIAVAADHFLIIVKGRDRKRPFSEAVGNDARPVVTKLSFPFSILSAAVGDFTGGAAQEMALLSDDGAARVLSRTASQSGEST